MNQSVSVHSSAASRVMRSSSLHPQQDTITSLVITWPLSMGCTISFFISFFMLFFLSLTGDSIAQSQKKASIKHHFFEKSFFYFLTILLDIGTIIVIFNFIIGPKCLPIKDLRAGVGPRP